MRQIFVRRADDDAFDARVRGGNCRSGRKSVVGFEFGHRPNHEAGRSELRFEQWKLREKLRLDACARLVAGPERVTE